MLMRSAHELLQGQWVGLHVLPAGALKPYAHASSPRFVAQHDRATPLP